MLLQAKRSPNSVFVNRLRTNDTTAVASWLWGTLFDLLLTDVVMPEMGGRALAQELSRRGPKTRIIYMSGSTGQGVGMQGPVEPGCLFWVKPFYAGKSNAQDP
jgi:CheY-like chemotaxis protein